MIVNLDFDMKKNVAVSEMVVQRTWQLGSKKLGCIAYLTNGIFLKDRLSNTTTVRKF